MESYEVAFNLVPLPKASAPSSSKVESKEPKSYYQPDGQTDKNNWRSKPYQNQSSKGNGKSRKGKSQMPPKAFQGRDCASTDPHGRRLCFGCNLGSCSAVADGASCKNGWHLCMHSNCHAPHREKDHDGQRPQDPRQGQK